MPTVSDKDPAVFDALAKRLQDKLFADKGYISQKLFDSLFEEGIQLVTGLRVNMKNKLMPFYDKMMLRKRYIIETINDHGSDSTFTSQVCCEFHHKYYFCIKGHTVSLATSPRHLLDTLSKIRNS